MEENNNLTQLHTALVNKGAVTGSVDDFKTYLSDDKNRNDLFEALKKKGAVTGSFNDFTSWLGMGETTTAASQPTATKYQLPTFPPERKFNDSPASILSPTQLKIARGEIGEGDTYTLQPGENPEEFSPIPNYVGGDYVAGENSKRFLPEQEERPDIAALKGVVNQKKPVQDYVAARRGQRPKYVKDPVGLMQHEMALTRLAKENGIATDGFENLNELGEDAMKIYALTPQGKADKQNMDNAAELAYDDFTADYLKNGSDQDIKAQLELGRQKQILEQENAALAKDIEAWKAHPGTEQQLNALNARVSDLNKRIGEYETAVAQSDKAQEKVNEAFQKWLENDDYYKAVAQQYEQNYEATMGDWFDSAATPIYMQMTKDEIAKMKAYLDDENLNLDHRQRTAIKRRVKDAEAWVKAAEKNGWLDKTFAGMQGKGAGIDIATMFRGMGNSLTLDRLSFGIGDALDARAIEKAMVKVRDQGVESLTPEEMALLESDAVLDLTKSIFNVDESAFNAGATTMEMLPFIAELWLSGGALGAIKGGVKAAVKGGAKGFGKGLRAGWKAAMKPTASQLGRLGEAGRFAPKTVGQVAKEVGMTAAEIVDNGLFYAMTTGLGHSVANTLEYMTPEMDSKYDFGTGKMNINGVAVDEQGNIKGGDKLGLAALKGFGMQAIEGGSEMLGEKALQPLLDRGGYWLRGMMGRQGRAMYKPYLRVVDDWIGHGALKNISGFGTEYAEELAGSVMRVITGLSTWDQEFNKQNLADTAYGLMPAQVAFAILGGGRMVGHARRSSQAKDLLDKYAPEQAAFYDRVAQMSTYDGADMLDRKTLEILKTIDEKKNNGTLTEEDQRKAAAELGMIFTMQEQIYMDEASAYMKDKQGRRMYEGITSNLNQDNGMFTVYEWKHDGTTERVPVLSTKDGKATVRLWNGKKQTVDLKDLSFVGEYTPEQAMQFAGERQTEFDNYAYRDQTTPMAGSVYYDAEGNIPIVPGKGEVNITEVADNGDVTFTTSDGTTKTMSERGFYEYMRDLRDAYEVTAGQLAAWRVEADTKGKTAAENDDPQAHYGVGREARMARRALANAIGEERMTELERMDGEQLTREYIMADEKTQDLMYDWMQNRVNDSYANGMNQRRQQAIAQWKQSIGRLPYDNGNVTTAVHNGNIIIVEDNDGQQAAIVDMQGNRSMVASGELSNMQDNSLDSVAAQATAQQQAQITELERAFNGTTFQAEQEYTIGTDTNGEERKALVVSVNEDGTISYATEYDYDKEGNPTPVARSVKVATATGFRDMTENARQQRATQEQGRQEAAQQRADMGELHNGKRVTIMDGGHPVQGTVNMPYTGSQSVFTDSGKLVKFDTIDDLKKSMQDAANALQTEQQAAIEAVANRITELANAMPNARIKVVTDINELRPDVQEFAKQGRLEAYFDPDTNTVVFYAPGLVANNSNVDGKVIHEVVIHYGLKNMLGEKDYAALCLNIFNNVMDENDRAQYVQYVKDTHPNWQSTLTDEKIMAMAADEWLAFTYENRDIDSIKRESLLQTIVNFIVDFFKKAGVDLNRDEVMAELDQLVAASRDWLRGEQVNQEEKKDNLLKRALESVKTALHIWLDRGGNEGYEWDRIKGKSNQEVIDIAVDEINSMEAIIKHLINQGASNDEILKKISNRDAFHFLHMALGDQKAHTNEVVGEFIDAIRNGNDVSFAREIKNSDYKFLQKETKEDKTTSELLDELIAQEGDNTLNKLESTVKAISKDIKELEGKLAEVNEAINNQPIAYDKKTKKANDNRENRRNQLKNQLKEKQQALVPFAAMLDELTNRIAAQQATLNEANQALQDLDGNLNPTIEAEEVHKFDKEPANADEAAADFLVGFVKKEHRINEQSLMQETNWSEDEVKNFRPATTPDGGMTLQEAAENLYNEYESEGSEHGWFKDPSEARDKLVSVMQEAGKYGELANYINQRRGNDEATQQMQAALDANAQQLGYADAQDMHDKRMAEAQAKLDELKDEQGNLSEEALQQFKDFTQGLMIGHEETPANEAQFPSLESIDEMANEVGNDAEEIERMTYKQGESIKDYTDRNGILSAKWYMMQKYADQWDKLADIMNGLTVENARQVGRNVSAIIDNIAEGQALLGLMRANSQYVLPFFDGVSDGKNQANSESIEGGEEFIQPTNEEAPFSVTRGTRYSVVNANQAIFVSNAARAVEGIKQEKATPEQWLKMVEKQGGLKAGEDKWLGLSQWLKDSEAKTLTKQEVLDFINENAIRIEETHYAELSREEQEETLERKVFRFTNNLNNEAVQRSRERGIPFAQALTEMLDERYGDEWKEYLQISGATGLVQKHMYAETYEVAQFLSVEYDKNAKQEINSTRLEYTTEGLDNKREIALTVPTIEPWNEGDEVHFGDAGEGRAVAWIRFGETTDADGNRVLVIDEIQSKRHQEGREKGYKTGLVLGEYALSREAGRQRMRMEAPVAELKDKETGEVVAHIVNNTTNGGKFYLVTKDNTIPVETEKAALDKADLLYGKGSIPAAPFEKNWMELAMKRMLRLAAEEGYDKVAWTTGEQQAERYNIGKVVDAMEVRPYKAQSPIESDGHDLTIHLSEGTTWEMFVQPDGTLNSDNELFDGKNVTEVFGKELGERIMSVTEPVLRLDNEDLRVGAEGMKGFYDKMIPSFMNKYGKQWGVKVGEVTMPNLEEGYQTMHSIDVNEQMKADVMEGQVMFSVKNSQKDTDDNQLSLFLQNNSGEYETQDGQTIGFTTLPDGDNSSVDSGTRPSEVQRENGATNPTDYHLRKLEHGETCHVERRYVETQGFDFTGSEKIETTDDVAYIFKQLENAAIENSFVVLIKDGTPTVIHTGIGSYDQTIVNLNNAMVAYQKLNPDKVYFVHNHPSGNIVASNPDKRVYANAKKLFGDKLQPGIIIDTTSGLYGTFTDTTEDMDNVIPKEVKNETPIKTYSFSKQVFEEDWKPSKVYPIRSSNDVATFVSSHRLGEHKKMSLLILTPQHNVIGNIFLPYTSLSEAPQGIDFANEVGYYINQMGGVTAILYGNFRFDSATIDKIKELKDGLKIQGLNLTDCIHISPTGDRYKSAIEARLLSENEAKYGRLTDEQIRGILSKENADTTGDPVLYSVSQAANTPQERLRLYDAMVGTKEVSKFVGRVTEGFYQSVVDGAIPLKRLQDVIAGRGKVTDAENAYLMEIARAARAKRLTDEAETKYYEPMMKAIAALTGRTSKKGYYKAMRDVELYVLAKSGLERNQWFWDEAKKSDPNAQLEDKSGLTALAAEFGEKDFTAFAQRLVADYEARHGQQKIDELWKCINAVSKNILDTELDGHLISQELHDDLLNRWKFYVPMRGFDEQVTSAFYAYQPSSATIRFENPFKKIKGRVSLADNPFVNLIRMTESAINLKGKNEVGLALLNLAASHEDNGLLRVGKAWEVKEVDPATGEVTWKAAYPKLSNVSQADIPAAIDAFQKAMMRQAKTGDARPSSRTAGGVRIHPSDIDQHVLKVKVGGQTVDLYLLGNPKAFQALNPTGKSKMGDKLSGLTRSLSGLMTTYNPVFMVRNSIRDFKTAAIITYTRDGAAGMFNMMGQWFGNMNALRKLIAGKSSGDATIDQYWQEFLEFGGDTGFTRSLNMEKQREDFNKKMFNLTRDKSGQAMYKITHWYFDWMEKRGNRYAEDITRFAVFCASRKQGRSAMQAAADAKNTTANFNKKGQSGFARFMSTNFAFFNAAIQGLNTSFHAFKDNPGRAATAAVSTMIYSMAIPFVNMCLLAMFGDDDDWRQYENMTQFVSNTHAVYYIPGAGFLTMPYPQDFVPFTSLGNIIWRNAAGFEKPLNGRSIFGNVMLQWFDTWADLLPVNAFEEGFGEMKDWKGVARALAPTWLSPVADVMLNRNFMGSQIRRKHFTLNDQKDLAPYWAEYDRNKNWWAHDIARLIAGGDEYRAGAAWRNVDPRQIIHLVEGYGGGTVKLMSDIAVYFEEMAKGDKPTLNQAPFIKKFWIQPNPDKYEGNLNGKLYEMAKYQRELEQQIKDLQKEADKAREDGNDKAAEKREKKIEEIQNSMEYRILTDYDVNGMMKDWREERNDITNDETLSEEGKQKKIVTLTYQKAAFLDGIWEEAFLGEEAPKRNWFSEFYRDASTEAYTHNRDKKGEQE